MWSRRAPASVLLLLPCVGSCDNDYDYQRVIAEAPDIHDVVSCEFEPTDNGWERYSCSPVFTATSPDALAWERDGIGSFDIAERRIFGAPFYQMWYSGHEAGHSQIGYAASADGVQWERHPLNPVLRTAIYPAAVDSDGASVGCLAFDGDLAAWHLWYIGDNNAIYGTRFAHATSSDGVVWAKDPRDVDPLADIDSDTRWLRRIWSCDALYDDGRFHFWGGGISLPPGVSTPETALDSYRSDIAWLQTNDGVHFDGTGLISLGHASDDSSAFDHEGVAQPSVVPWTTEDGVERWVHFYTGIEDLVATYDPSTQFTRFDYDGRALGWAVGDSPDGPWTRLGATPLFAPSEGTAESSRAIVVQDRVHLYHSDVFQDAAGQPVPGIGLAIAPVEGAVIR